MTTQYDSAGAIRTIARGAGTILAILIFLAFAPKFISDLSTTATPVLSGREWEGQAMAAMFLTFMIGYALTWWRWLWGGIVICVSSLVVSLPFIIIQGHFNSLVFGLPLFVVGLLYVAVHMMESRESSNKEQEVY